MITPLTPIATLLLKLLMLSEQEAKSQVSIQVSMNGKQLWVVLVLAHKLLQLLFGMLTTMTGLHSVIIHKLEDGDNPQLNNSLETPLSVELELMKVSIDLNADIKHINKFYSF